MYFAAIQQFSRGLKNLDSMLDKAGQHAVAKKFDPNLYCTSRLAPDMFNLTRQIQIACDVAKSAAATLAGKDAPKSEDTEQTLEQLRERIRKTHGYLETFRPEDFAKLTPQSVVKVPYPQGKAMHAEDSLLTRSIPNFYFHYMAAYALLRADGVDLGKSDFLGDLKMFDA